jgi:hypothetical protein
LLKKHSELKKVLICADSFGIIDPDFPDLHFSEKILDNTPPVFELHNLAHGGDSNALIVLQLLQGLQFDPDFVILLFTSTHRHVIDKNKNVHYPKDVSVDALKEFRHDRYATSSTVVLGKESISNLIDNWNTTVISDEFEIMKNYFLIHYCFQLLEKKNIPFCYSLGGMGKVDYSSIVDKNFIKNHINEYSSQALKINLWNHHCNQPRPYFHVNDDSIQSAFANECIHHLRNANIL